MSTITAFSDVIDDGPHGIVASNGGLHPDDRLAIEAATRLLAAQARGADLIFDHESAQQLRDLATTIAADPKAGDRTRTTCIRLLAKLEAQRVADVIALGRLVLERDRATRTVVEDGAARVSSVPSAAVQVNTYTTYPNANGAPILPATPAPGSALEALEAEVRAGLSASSAAAPVVPAPVIPWAPDPMSGGPKPPPKPRRPRATKAEMTRRRALGNAKPPRRPKS